MVCDKIDCDKSAISRVCDKIKGLRQKDIFYEELRQEGPQYKGLRQK
jgi:hypothetical protein